MPCGGGVRGQGRGSPRAGRKLGLGLPEPLAGTPGTAAGATARGKGGAPPPVAKVALSTCTPDRRSGSSWGHLSVKEDFLYTSGLRVGSAATGRSDRSQNCPISPPQPAGSMCDGRRIQVHAPSSGPWGGVCSQGAVASEGSVSRGAVGTGTLTSGGDPGLRDGGLRVGRGVWGPELGEGPAVGLPRRGISSR